MIKIYTTPTCIWCKKTKEFLKKNNIRYKEISIVGNKKATDEMIKKSGSMSVPVLDIDGQIIVGYNIEKIKKALKL